MTALLLGKQLATQTERKAGWNHRQSGRFAEEMNPLILPGIKLRLLAHKPISQQNCHEFCRILIVVIVEFGKIKKKKEHKIMLKG